MKNKYVLKIALTLGLFTSTFFVQSQNFKLLSDWEVLNGNVNSIIDDTATNTVYLGGDFTHIGPSIPYGAALLKSNGAPDLRFLKPNDVVRSVVADGRGGWFIGGQFTKIGDSTRNYIAQIDSNGLVSPWNPMADNYIETMSLRGNKLYVGGGFNRIGGQTRQFLAALNTSTGLATTWNPRPNDYITAVFVYDNKVYTAGGFTDIGGQRRNHLAALDTFNGAATSWDPDADGPAISIAAHRNNIYVAGKVTLIGGQSRHTVAEIDSGNGRVTSWDARVTTNGVAYTVAVYGNKLYIAGNFDEVRGERRNNIASFNLANGNLTNWDPNINGNIYDIKGENNIVYVAGSFDEIGALNRNNIAAIDTLTGIATAWNPIVNNLVFSVATSSDKVYIGGNFTSVGGVFRKRVMALNAKTGVPTAWNPNVDGSVASLLMDNNIIYVGGSFTNIGGVARNRIAAIDKATGIPTAWNPNSNNRVNAMVISGTTLYVGGTFTTIGGQTRQRIAALNTTINTNNATTWNPNATNGAVNTLALAGSTLYVGGTFTNIGGQTRNRIAALDISSNTANPWNPNANGAVNAIVIRGTKIYAGGSFTNIGGQTRNRIASLDNAIGMADAWNPNANNTINSLVIRDSAMVVGGNFTNIGAQNRNRLALIDLNSSNALGWSPDINNNSVLSILSSRDMIYAGGSFSIVNNVTRNNIVAFEECSPAAPTGADTQTYCNTATVANLVASGQNIKWYGSAVGGSPLSASVNLSNGNNYFATQTIDGCESSVRFAVNVRVNSPAPSGASVQTFCNSATVSDLIAVGQNIKWYDASSGGNLLNSSTALVGGSRYFASQTIDGCEGNSRLMVNVVINSPAPNGAAVQSFCNRAKVSNLAASGSGIKWYATLTGGTALNPTDDLVDGNTYFASQTINGCEGLERLEVKVEIVSTSAPSGTAIQTFCINATVSQLVAIGSNIKWYDSIASGNLLLSNLTLVNGRTYYASQTVNSCESENRFAVQANINIPAAPTGLTTQTFCNSATVADLIANGTDIKWHLTASGTITLPTSTALINQTNYFASQTIDGCESPQRLQVFVVINSPTPTGASVQSFCNSAQVSDLTATGSNIQWYATSSGGTPLSSNTALVNSNIYYASQTIDGCESASRLAVSVNIALPALPTGSTAQAFCNSAELSDLFVSGTNIKWYSMPTGGQILPLNTLLTNGSTYYASQTIQNCEGNRLGITVAINSTSEPTGQSVQTFCKAAKISDIVVSGQNIRWFASQSGGLPLENNFALAHNSTYYATQTLNNCESQNRLTVVAEIIAPAKAVTQNDTSLIALGENLSYQWLNCDNGFTPIQNEVSQMFIPKVSGNYAVKVSQNNCSDTSECRLFNVISGLNSKELSTFNVFPNPARDYVIIEVHHGHVGKNYYLYNSLGKMVKSGQIIENQTRIDLSDLASGIYSLNVGMQAIQKVSIVK